MPGYRGHLVGGLATYLGLMYILQPISSTPLSPLWWLFFSLTGALFPDIDIKSKGQKWFFRIIVVTLALLVMHKHYASAALLGLISMTPMLSKHRGLFHNPWFILVASGAIVFTINAYCAPYVSLCNYDTLFFVSGALSHVALDLGIAKTFRKYLFLRRVR